MPGYLQINRKIAFGVMAFTLIAVCLYLVYAFIDLSMKFADYGRAYQRCMRSNRVYRKLLERTSRNHSRQELLGWFRELSGPVAVKEDAHGFSDGFISFRFVGDTLEHIQDENEDAYMRTKLYAPEFEQ